MPTYEVIIMLIVKTGDDESVQDLVDDILDRAEMDYHHVIDADSVSITDQSA